jgi:hypothetical protein
MLTEIASTFFFNPMGDDLKTFHVNKCPQKLIDRIHAKAALKGKKCYEWVIEVLERETEKLKPLQDEYNKEDEE